jgi:hypothetical protein
MKNRIIKFRIWDNGAGVFRTENECPLHCMSNWSIDAFDGTVVDYVCAIDSSDEDEGYSRNPDPGWYMDRKAKKMKAIKKPCYILQQFTGLKDKNKKEIYDGDISKTSESMPYQVVFSELGRWEAYRPQIDSGCCLFRINKSCKIIGNIFENKDLLK